MNNYKNLLDRHHKYLRYLLVLSLIPFVILLVAETAHGAWYDSNWQYRKKITIQSSKVSGGPHSNFPVLISLSSDTELAANARNDGYDILFTSDDEVTKIAHEREKFDGGTGELAAWVKVGSVSSSGNTDIYMYYGNPSAGDQQLVAPTKSDVWSDYVGVWHLDETSGTHFDSTSNGNDATPQNGVNQNATGKLDGADDFDGNNDYVEIGTTGFSTTNMTFSAWVKADALADRRYIFGHTTQPAFANRIQLYTAGTAPTVLGLGLGDTHSKDTGSVLSTGTWYHVALVMNATNYWVYLNSALDMSGTYTGLSALQTYADIGNDGNSLERTESWNGVIDEVRISNTVRPNSAQWIQTEYNNQVWPNTAVTPSPLPNPNPGGGFITVDTEVSGGGGGNQAPTVDAGAPKTIVLPDNDVDLDDASASDSDGPSGLTFTWSQVSVDPPGGTATFAPDNQELNPTASFDQAGEYVLKLSAYDGAATSEDTVTITVNSSGGGGLGTPINAGDVAGYSCNMKITIDNTKVAFTSENFPVLISLADDSLKTSGCSFVTDPDGDDIIFTNSNLTLQLYHEIEKYDETTGEIVAWVLVPALSGTTDTDIYMYFGNSSVTSPTESPTDVWDSDYAGVWHLKEDAATGAPSTYHERIEYDADDSEESSGGSIDWGSTDFELVNGQQVGMRWRNVTIPQGATITSAYIEFTADETDSVTTNLTFWGQDADNAAVFADVDDNISDRTKTSASASWNNIPAWSTVPATHQSSDISPVIQEIVNRGGWASGNALVVIVTGSGTRTAESHDGVSGSAPLLHVEYTTATDVHVDSTSNDNDGIPNGNTLTASGKIDGAQDFDGNGDSVQIPHDASLNLTGAMTISFWIYPTQDSGTYNRVVDKSYTTSYYFGGGDGTNDLTFYLDGNLVIETPNNTFSINTWNHAAVTYTSGGDATLFLNGTQIGTGTYTGGITGNTDTLYISSANSSYDFAGFIDEVRISNSDRSAAWIQTSYNNQNDPLSFYSVEKNCPSTIPPIAEFTCSIPLTIDSSKVSGTADLTNFPVLISLTNTSLRTTGSCGYVENSSGYDIIFSDATQTIILDHEIEKYDGASGELVAWVRVPTLKYNEDTVINIHYGHSSVCGASENPTDVWNSNYKGVWHLGDTSGATQDSTSYNTGGSLSGTVTRGATGQIGDAFNFYTDGEVDWGDPAHLDFGTGEMTLSLWANIDNNRGQWEQLILKGKSSWEPGYQFEIDSSSNNLYFGINDGSYSEWGVSANIPFSLDTWTYFVGVVDRNNNLVRGYRDGVQIDTGNISSVGSINVSDPLTIGRNTWGWPDARIDEVRLSNTARSADWIQTEYNNQSNPSSFYSVGASSCFLGGFSCNRRITIDSTKVEGSSDLTNFPFLIRIQNDCNLKSATNGGGVQNSSGWDIIFTDSDGVTQLDHEIEEYEGSTGDLTAWVRVPTLPYNSDKDIYLHYGKSGLTCDPSNPTGVWDSSYEAVYHLNDDFEDSTSHNRDATAEDTDTYASVIADGENFGPQDEIAIGNWGFGGDELTLQAWARFDDFDQNDPRVFSKASGTSEQNHVFMLGLGGNLEQHLRMRVKTGTDDLTGTTTIVDTDDPLGTGTWYLIAGTYDGSNMRLLSNGVEVHSAAKTGNLRLNSWNIALGNTPGGTSSTGYSMDGKLDEVRILSAARSADWLKTEYNNQNNPDSFYSMSQDTCGGAYGLFYKWCKKITVDSSQVPEDLGDFPLLINISGDNDLKTVANGGLVQHSQGWDIVFRTDGCGNLEHEIEKYDGDNGDLVAWVKTDLSSGTDTKIYMYYGANVLCDTSNPTGVWDSNYVGVWHLDETVSDESTAGTHYDSTGNSNNGAQNDNDDTQDGKIGTGQMFDGSSDWIQVPNSSSLDITGDKITLSAWVKSTADQNDDAGIVIKNNQGGVYNYNLNVQTSDQGNFRVTTSTGETYLTAGPALTANQWYFLYGIYDGANAKLYLDGSEEGTAVRAGNILSTTEPVLIGRRALDDARYFTGYIDEVHISNVARTTNWMITEYRNQSDPGNFYTITSCYEQTTGVTQKWVEEVQ